MDWEQTVKVLSLQNKDLQWSRYPLDFISRTALFCSHLKSSCYYFKHILASRNMTPKIVPLSRGCETIHGMQSQYNAL